MTASKVRSRSNVPKMIVFGRSLRYFDIWPVNSAWALRFLPELFFPYTKNVLDYFHLGIFLMKMRIVIIWNLQGKQ